MLAMEEDRERWDQRYSSRLAGPATAPEAPEALCLLDDVIIQQMPTRGLALDIGCGAGAQTLWLARRGLRVVALDVSPIAIGLTRSAAQEHRLVERIDARVLDLDRGLPDDAMGAALVLCQRFRAPGLYSEILDALGAGGVAIVTVLSEVGRHGASGEFHARPGELVEAFSSDGLETLASWERAGIASIVVRRQ